MNYLKKYWVGVFLVFLVSVASIMIYNKLHEKKLPENLIMGSGRIDGDLINISSKYPGRIEKLFVNEGDKISKEALLAIISSDEYKAKAAVLQARIDAAKKELSSKRKEFSIELKTVPLSLSKADAGYKSALAQKRALEKNIDSLKNLLLQDQKDLKRVRSLYEQKLIQKHEVELARLKYRTDNDKLQALLYQKEQLIQALNVAKIAQQEAKAMQGKLAALKDGIAALEENVKALIATKAEVEVVLKELSLYSPVSGYVVQKIANASEVISAGMPVLILTDPKTMYLKLFIDTIQNGKIKIGDKAVIFLDAYPDKPIASRVVSIAQKAEFTPKEVSVRDDRIQRVFAVHLKPLIPDPLLKPGIPAIGVISTDGKNLPDSLKQLPPL